MFLQLAEKRRRLLYMWICDVVKRTLAANKKRNKEERGRRPWRAEDEQMITSDGDAGDTIRQKKQSKAREQQQQEQKQQQQQLLMKIVR